MPASSSRTPLKLQVQLPVQEYMDVDPDSWLEVLDLGIRLTITTGRS